MTPPRQPPWAPDLPHESTRPTVRPLPTPQTSTGSERAAFQRVAGVLAGLSLLVAATYLVPAIRPLRPWIPGGDYVPFWNIVGRELLGEGAALEAEATKLDELRQSAELA